MSQNACMGGETHLSFRRTSCVYTFNPARGHRNATSSAFSRVVRVQPGAYRVLVRVTSGAQISNYGRTLLIG